MSSKKIVIRIVQKFYRYFKAFDILNNYQEKKREEEEEKNNNICYIRLVKTLWGIRSENLKVGESIVQLTSLYKRNYPTRKQYYWIVFNYQRCPSKAQGQGALCRVNMFHEIIITSQVRLRRLKAQNPSASKRLQ